MPSLQQLNEAIASYHADHPDALMTVVVDATFGHRIDPKEVPAFERAIETNAFVAPPAGAVGRGDGFILSIAQKANASILSNDSYQEFHGEYSWLFDEGRLIGGKPVPHVGWVWVNRVPVRGPVSRRSVKEQKIVDKSPGRRRGAKSVSDAPAISADGPMPIPTAAPPGAIMPGQKPVAAAAPPAAESGRSGRGRRSGKGEVAKADGALGANTSPNTSPNTSSNGTGRQGAGVTDGRSADSRQHEAPKADGGKPDPAKTTNDLLAFLSFVEHFPVGTAVTGVVETYSSHGAYVLIGDVHGYVPLRLMADPAPRSAREVMDLGETVTLVVNSFVPARRSIDLAVPSMAPATTPVTPAKRGGRTAKAKQAAAATEAVVAEAIAAAPAAEAEIATSPRRRTAKKAAASATTVTAVVEAAAAETPTAAPAAVPAAAGTRRRTAKPKASSDDVAQAPAVSSSASPATPASGEQPSGEPAGPRKRTTKRSATPAAPAESAPVAVETAPVDVEPAKAPAAKAPARRRPAKKAAS